MAPDRHLHEMIYASLKSVLVSQRYRPGEPIDVKGLPVCALRVIGRPSLKTLVPK